MNREQAAAIVKGLTREQRIAFHVNGSPYLFHTWQPSPDDVESLHPRTLIRRINEERNKQWDLRRDVLVAERRASELESMVASLECEVDRLRRRR